MICVTMPDRDSLINALANEYERLCHEVPDEDDMSREEYVEHLSTHTYSDLIKETDTDEGYFKFEEWYELWNY